MGGSSSRPAVGEDGQPEEPQLSYWQMMRLGYAELVNAIIRPPRAEYEMAHLGPASFEFCDRRFRRVDFQIANERGMRLQCSQWEPEDLPPGAKLPCLIYMHGNSSARVEALPQLSLCLALGISLVSMDFAGSGLSDGEFVSLGFFEKDDLRALIQHLRATGKVSSIALWGRSMGAATALMHGERDPSIAAMVLDSSFADLTQLADEMVEKGREHGLNVPRFVTRLTLRMIKSSVQARAGFSINHLTPIAHAPRCFIPALFIAGKHDDFISPQHSQQIHDAYAGDKNLILVEGDHNSIRPRFMYHSVANFLQLTLQLKEPWALPGADKYVGMPPWIKAGGEGQLLNYLDDDDAMADYWSDYVFDDVIGSPVGRLSRDDGGVYGSSDTIGSAEAAHQMGIGMTQARQREVQAALYHALGQRGPAPNGSGSVRHVGEEADAPSSTTSSSQQGSSSTSLGSSSHRPSQGGSRRRLPEPWSCPACTLFNSSRRRSCEACGTEAPPRQGEGEEGHDSFDGEPPAPHPQEGPGSNSKPSADDGIGDRTAAEEVAAAEPTANGSPQRAGKT